MNYKIGDILFDRLFFFEKFKIIDISPNEYETEYQTQDVFWGTTEWIKESKMKYRYLTLKEYRKQKLQKLNEI